MVTPTESASSCASRSTFTSNARMTAYLEEDGRRVTSEDEDGGGGEGGGREEDGDADRVGELLRLALHLHVEREDDGVPGGRRKTGDERGRGRGWG